MTWRFSGAVAAAVMGTTVGIGPGGSARAAENAHRTAAAVIDQVGPALKHAAETMEQVITGVVKKPRRARRPGKSLMS
jgi:hypothetical protein